MTHFNLLSQLMNLPQELRHADQWAVTKPNDKSPWQKSGEMASSTNPATWCSFEESRLAAGIWGGRVGYMLDKTDPYVCIYGLCRY